MSVCSVAEWSACSVAVAGSVAGCSARSIIVAGWFIPPNWVCVSACLSDLFSTRECGAVS